MAVLIGGLTALLFLLHPFGRAVALTFLIVLLYLTGQYMLFQTANYVLPAVRPVVGVLAATLLFFGYVIVVKDRDRRLVKDVFLKSVSPRIGEEILRNYGDDAIWGAQREISVLFVDVRGYTTLSERHGPDVVLRLLERFYEGVSEIVFRHDGQVNKFLGDAVLALFGALPEEGADHAARALRSALEIQQAMMRLNDSEFIRNIGVPINTGAGVNTGEATVGLVGRRRIRIEYTALGDAVNVASRLQTNASEGEVIVSARSVELLGGEEALRREYPALRITPESLRVKGKEKPLQVYRLVLQSSTPLEKEQQDGITTTV
jgi:adenylate cyclase